MAVKGSPYLEISDDYFKPKEYPAKSINSIKVEMCSYNMRGVTPQIDISDKIIDYSYSCVRDDNIRQSASITIKSPVNDNFWYMRRENKMYYWVDTESEFITHSVLWNPCLYHIIKTYSYIENCEKITKELDLGYFIPSSNTYNYDSTTGTVTVELLGLSALLTAEYGGTVTTMRVNGFPTTLSIEKGVNVNNNLFYDVAMGSFASNEGISPMNITSMIPLKGVYIDYGQKFNNIPYDIDFDANVSRMDMIQEIMDTTFEGANCWIDEKRYLNISSKPTKRGDLIMRWSEYSNLFISESVSYDDSNYFNATEVYGRDNNCFGYSDNSPDNEAGFQRKQVLQFDELTTNEECQLRADWENYKAQYGRQTISVTILDRYISWQSDLSSLIGRTIEYTSVDGDTNLYFLEKLSYSGNTWTMELKLFKPLYQTDDIKQYTLSIPTIVRHEINNNVLRLYIDSEDITYAAVKIYMSRALSPDFKTITTLTTNDGLKYVDIPITRNGSYSFLAALYSPYFEDSPIGGGELKDYDPYVVNINEIYVPAVTEDPDPYPHPHIFKPTEKHKPRLLTNSGKPLTSDNDEYLTI